MKRWSKITAVFLVFAMILTLIPATQAEAAKKKVTVKKVAVTSSLSGSSKTVVVAKGKKVNLKTTVTVTPNKAANKKVSYSVKDEKIATVSSKGVVKGVKAGKTKITVTSKTNKKKKASINVKVVTGTVTKVTLNKKSGSLNVGDKVKLKATVKAKKGADKTIAWKSSKEAVATVNAKGEVTAVKAGTATITAQAIDGSGKKAAYKVTVKDPVFLTGIQVLNSQSVTFSLNKAYPIDVNAISIMKKSKVNGTYRNQLVIENMSTTDNMNYTVVLSNDSRIKEQEYVQISIPSLTGAVKSLETLYEEAVCAYTGESVSAWTVSEYSSRTFSFDASGGYSSLNITNLPAGLTAENKNGELCVKGTPVAPGVTDAVLTAVDELGNTMTRTIHFIVGSDTVLAGAAITVYGVRTGTKAGAYTYPRVTGGSDSYEYSIVSDPSNIVSNKDANGKLSDEDVYFEIAFPGEYSITVRATDKKDANRYCDIVIPIKMAQGISIGGCVTDAQGNKIPNADITFTNKNKADLYYSVGSASTNVDGVYSATVTAGNYDIEVSYGGSYSSRSQNAQATRYLYNQALAATQTGFDIQLPLYKVLLQGYTDPTTQEKVTAAGLSWYWNHEYMGEGEALYVKAGNYALEAEQTKYIYVNNERYIVTYKYTANANVVNSGVQTAITKTEIKREKDNSYYYYDDDDE